jgi:Putative peptidoglycan binding domain
MAGRDKPRSRNPDDWFSGLEPGRSPGDGPNGWSAPPARGEGGEDDDWLGDDPRPRRPHSDSPVADFFADRRRVAMVAGGLLAVIVLIAVLAAAGVFSGSNESAPPTVPTTLPTTTAQTTPPPPAPTFAAPTTTLKPGDTGAQVRVLQRALTHLGYPVGKIDGDYGSATKAAVAKFQTAEKLTADGIFGPATRTALVKALRTG